MADVEPLLAELGEVLDRADPIPDAVVAAARSSFVWRTIDAELAELSADSHLTSGGVRSGGASTTAGAARLLTFEATGIDIEVEVNETGGARQLMGQIVPVGEAHLTVRWVGGERAVDADVAGRFTVADIPAGAISIAITRPGSTRAVVTSWVII